MDLTDDQIFKILDACIDPRKIDQLGRFDWHNLHLAIEGVRRRLARLHELEKSVLPKDIVLPTAEQTREARLKRKAQSQ